MKKAIKSLGFFPNQILGSLQEMILYTHARVIIKTANYFRRGITPIDCENVIKIIMIIIKITINTLFAMVFFILY